MLRVARCLNPSALSVNHTALLILFSPVYSVFQISLFLPLSHSQPMMQKFSKLLFLLVSFICCCCTLSSPASAAAAPSSKAAARIPDASDSTGSSLTFAWRPAGANQHAPVSLTGANFFDLVLDSRQAWLVAFVASWCGHCKALHPAFDAASRVLVSTVRLGIVETTDPTCTQLTQQFKIASYPTVLTFPAGRKKPEEVRKYEGGRDKDSIVAHAKSLLSLSAIKKVSAAHKAFPRNVLTFFAGSAASNFTGAATLPSLLVFLHIVSVSDEIKALSQSFQHRLNFGVVSAREEKEKPLARLFRVRSTPCYILCAPAIHSRANETGRVLCGEYAHAKSGTSVPSVSKFLVEFIQDTTSSGDEAEREKTREKYALRSIIIDSTLAAGQASDVAAALDAGASAVAVELPAPVQSAIDFHARCTDLPSGICLLLFVPLDAIQSPQLQEFLGEMNAWNGRNKARKSMQFTPLLLPASSLAAAALLDNFGVLLHPSPTAVSLLALLPKRNRFFSLADFSFSSIAEQAASLDAATALEWMESVAREDKQARVQKQANLQQRMRDLVPSTAQEGFFTDTTTVIAGAEAAAELPIEATTKDAAVHSEL